MPIRAPVKELWTSISAAVAAMPTPSAKAAVQQCLTFDLTQVVKNPKNGAQSVPLKVPICVRLGGLKRENGLRCPFGGPSNFDPSKTDRVSFSVAVAADSAEATYAKTVDDALKQAFKERIGEFMPSTTAEQLDAKWKTWYKAPKKEEHSPVLSAKVQKTGGRPTRFYEAVRVDDKTERRKMTEEDLEKVNWKYARVAAIVEIRSVWFQPHQLGLTVDATEVMVHLEDDTSGFDSEDSE